MEGKSGQMILSAGVVSLIALLVIWQGGFYAMSYDVCGMVFGALGVAVLVFSAITGLKKKSEGCPGTCSVLIPLLLLGVGCAFLASAAVNGPTLSNMQSCVPWMIAATAAVLVGEMGANAKAKMLSWLSWFGVVTALIGAAVFSGALEVPGAMVVGRLQITFQYANAAGIWFATIALLIPGLADTRIRSCFFAVSCALLMTQSGGSLVVFALGFIAFAVMLIKEGEWAELSALLLQLVLAGLVFLAFKLQSLIGLAAFAFVFVGCIVLMPRILARFADPGLRMGPKGVSAASGLLMVALVVIGACVMSGRIAEAMMTLQERIWQMRDACALLATSPIIGIGPGEWQWCYRFMQTNVYDATVVHNSYLQIALDSGLVGLLLFIAAIVVGVCKLAKDEHMQVLLIPVLAMMAHAIIDIDLAFSSLLVLLSVLLSCGSGGRIGKDRKYSAGTQMAMRVCGVGCAVVLLIASVFSLGLQLQKAAIEDAASSGDYDAIAKTVAGDGLAANDQEAVASLYRAYLVSGDGEKLSEAAQKDGLQEEQVAIISEGLINAGLRDEATALLEKAVEEQPFNKALHESLDSLS